MHNTHNAEFGEVALAAGNARCAVVLDVALDAVDASVSSAPGVSGSLLQEVLEVRHLRGRSLQNCKNHDKKNRYSKS